MLFGTLLAVFVLVLAACSGDSGAETSESQPAPATAEESTAQPAPESEGVNMVLLPKFLGILVFDQAYDGALEAANEFGDAGGLEFLGPTPENSVAGQIDIVTTAATQGVDGIMISNNAGDQIVPAAEAAARPASPSSLGTRPFLQQKASRSLWLRSILTRPA